MIPNVGGFDRAQRDYEAQMKADIEAGGSRILVQRHPLLPGERPDSSYRPATSSNENCEVCGLPALGHLQCGDCGIFIGPEHIDKAVTEDGYCGTCARTRMDHER